jgi:hypothetical protein
VDGGSTDGTWDALTGLANDEARLKLKQIPRDWTSPRHAIFDGVQKAEARKMCTSEFCWQSDADEVVHEMDVTKIHQLVDKFPTTVDIVCLPVVEYWGSLQKVRMDINPAKWRLSRNKPNITHGVPASHRLLDENGEMFSAGSDGCDMIDANTFEPLPALGFVTANADQVRAAAIQRNEKAFEVYQAWFNKMLQVLPAVHHYSWIDIDRKIRHYKEYWQLFWESLYNKKMEDTAENNMFFDVPWSEVSDEMIADRARQLAESTGGHIFHTKWDPEKTIPWLSVDRTEPGIMIDSRT